MTDRPVLVLGGGGLLGTALVAELGARGGPVDAPPRAELDVTDLRAVETRLDRIRPRLVINAAAFTDVVAAEKVESRAAVLAVNRDGPAGVARACARHGIALVHVSTDFVFDGSATRPYREDDPPAPIQFYGRSKWEGERAVLAAYPRATIVRTSTLYGPGRRARPHYVDAIVRQARAQDRLAVVATPIASPTYSPDLARAILDLLETRATGVFHVANRGGCSRLELTREIVRALGASAVVDERPEDPAPPLRPRYCVLDTGRFESLTGRPTRPWAEAVAEYVRRDGR